jgi:hypothetical protein
MCSSQFFFKKNMKIIENLLSALGVEVKPKVVESSWVAESNARKLK